MSEGSSPLSDNLIKTASMLVDIGWRMGLVGVSLVGILCVVFFPYSTDAPLTSNEQTDLQKYYATAYAKQDSVEQDENSFYVENARWQADQAGVSGQVGRFVEQYGL